MKIIIDKNTALPTIKTVAEVIDKKPVNPVLSSLHLSVKKSCMQIVGSNGETTITALLPVTQENDADKLDTLVEASMLVDAIKELPEGSIGLDFDTESKKLTVVWGTGKANIPLYQNVKEFPSAIAPGKDAKKIVLSSETLAAGLNKTAFATSADDIRPALTGVFFNIEEKALDLVASDSHILMRQTAELRGDALPEDASFILHYMPATLLKGMLKGDDCNVEITFDKRRASFCFRNMKVDVMLIDAKYPAYRSIFPKDNDCTLRVNRSELLHTLRRIVPYASKETGTVILSLTDKGGISVKANDVTAGLSSAEKVTGRYEGRTFDIGLDSDHLMDVLNKYDSEEVELTMKDPTKAAVLKPCGNESCLGLIMPKMIV